MTSALWLGGVLALLASTVQANECSSQLASRCTTARKASASDCVVCALQQSARLPACQQTGGVNDADIDAFCHPMQPSACPSGYTVQGACVPVGQSPLEYYLQQPDSTCTYDRQPLQTFAVPGARVSVLNMTSQRWMTEAIFKPTSPSRSVWYQLAGGETVIE